MTFSVVGLLAMSNQPTEYSAIAHCLPSFHNMHLHGRPSSDRQFPTTSNLLWPHASLSNRNLARTYNSAPRQSGLPSILIRHLSN